MSHRVADALHEVTDTPILQRIMLHALPHSCCSLQGVLADACFSTQQAVIPRQMYGSQHFSAQGVLLLCVLLVYMLIMCSPLCCGGSVCRLLGEYSSICSLLASPVFCCRLCMRGVPVTAWCLPAQPSCFIACFAAACQHKLQVA